MSQRKIEIEEIEDHRLRITVRDGDGITDIVEGPPRFIFLWAAKLLVPWMCVDRLTMKKNRPEIIPPVGQSGFDRIGRYRK